uniref:Uncharacterized protein n=1 Tax=Timema douglasi TaxID=61478 RepID=A0A7R8VT82_TIMDO|nr:unnamed protein product [Timema douglasi]
MDSILEESHAASGPDKLQAGSSLDAAEDGGGTISLKDQNDAAIQCIIDANIMCSDGRMISPGVPTVTQQQHMFPSAQPQQMFSQQDYLPQVEQHTPSMVSFDTSLGQLVSEACADMPEMSDIGNTELNKGTCLTNATEQNLTLVTPSSSHLTEQYIVLERSSFSHQLDGNITVNAATAVSENPLVLASSVATRVEGAALSKQNTTHQLPNAMPDDQVITESQLMNMPTLILCPTTHVVPFKIIPAKKKRPVAIAPSVKKRRTQTILPKPTFTFTADNQHPPMCISQNTMTSSIHSPKNITSSELGKLTQQPLTSRIANSTKLLENKSISTQLQTNKISKPKEDIASCSTANTSNVVHISDTNTCTLSLPKILDSPVTQVPSQSITEGIPGASEGEMQDKEEEKREQLLGALHLTQSPYKNRVPSTPNSSGKTPAGNDSVRLLSPQLMTLVNISKTNISNGTGEGKSPIDKRKEGSDGKISEAPRETPNNLSESQQETVNPRRLSLSTPRRRRNHIRALDFSTPPKFSLTPNMRKSFTSPKASGKKISPRSAKPIRRAGLFKSPPMVVNSQKNQCLFKAPAEKPTPTVLFKSPENSPTGNFDTTTLLTKDTSSTKVDAFCPIATRSPVPSLSGGWDKVTGAGLIFEDSSQKLLKHPSTESVEQGSNNNLEGIGVSSSQKNEYVESITNNEDKLQKISSPAANKLSDMWDADLRAHLVPNYVEPDPPIKTTVQKLVKRSVQKPVKRGVKKPVKRSVKKSKANKAAKRNSRKVTAEEVRKLEEGLNIMSDIEGSDGIETIGNKTNSLKSQITKSPVLDTPMKKNFTEPGPHLSDVSSLIPLTPRVLSPRAVEDTPITKFLKEQICSYESSFDTPSFPRTPNVPLTPRSSPQGNIEDQEYSTRPTDYSSCSSYYKPNEEIDPPNSSLEQVLIEECCRIEENTDVNKVEKSNEQTKEKEIPTGSSQENKHICDSESLQADNLKSPPVLNECCDVKESNISVSPKAKEREEIDKVLKDKPHGQSSSSIKTNIGTTLVEVSALVESGTDKSDIVLNLGIDKQNTSNVKTKSNQVTENCSKETSGESKSLPNIAPDYENKNKPITEMVISDEQQKTTNDKPSERCARTSLYYIKETKKIYSPKRSHRKQSRTKDRNIKKNVQTVIQHVISPEDKTKLISGFLNKARTEYAISLASSKDNSHNIELDKNELSKIKDVSKPQLNENKTNRLTFDNVTGSPLLKSAKSRRLFDISSDSSDNSNGGASLQIQTSSSCFSSLESVNYEIHKSKHNELPLKQIHSDTNEASSSKSTIKNKDDEKEHCITPALETLNYEASSSSPFEGKISEDTNLDSPSTNADTITSTIASIVQETAQNVDKNEVFKNERDKELLSELEDKRTRTLAKLKNPQNSKVKASISKSLSENPPVVEAPLLEDKQTEFFKIGSKGEECRFKEMRHPDEQSTFSTMERLQQQKEFQNMMKTPLKTPQSCLFSSPEEFPSLHLSSDDEVEGTSQTSGGLTPLSRVELQLAKIHGEKFKRNKIQPVATRGKTKQDLSEHSEPDLKPTKVIENSLTQKREHVKSLMTSKDSDKNIEIVSEVPLISEKTSSNCEKTITIIYKGDGPLCKRSVSPDNIENCSISTVIMGEDEDDMVVTARVTPFFELLSLKSQKDISLKDNELNKVANTRKHSFDTKPLNKMDESLLHKSTTKKQIETSRTGLKSKCVKKLDTDKQESCKSHSNYSQSASKRSNVNRALKKSNKMISPLSILDKEYELETRDIKNTRRSDHDRPSRKYEGKSKPRGSRYEERESQYRGPRRRTSSPHHRQRSWHRDLHRRSRTPTYRRVQRGSEDLTEDQSKIVYSRSSCERHIFQDSFTSPDRMKSRVTPAIKTRHKEEEEDLNVGDSHSAHSYTGDSVADFEELFQLQKGPFHPERSPFRLQDSPSDREEDDDLMTYALVGSHSKHKPSRPLPFKKSQCNDTLVRSSGTKTDQASTSASVRDERQSLPPKKRKASIEAAAPPPEKKACPDDPQMLLKKVDLEKFLSVVHGDMQETDACIGYLQIVGVALWTDMPSLDYFRYKQYIGLGPCCELARGGGPEMIWTLGGS